MDIEDFEEGDKQDFVEHLLEIEALDQPADGIARLFVDRGYEGLSDKQKFVLETFVLGEHRVENCARCSQSIPWSEQRQALDTGLCGYCEHMMNKDD